MCIDSAKVLRSSSGAHKVCWICVLCACVLPLASPSWLGLVFTLSSSQGTEEDCSSHTFKPHLENFEHYFATMWDECNCVVVWTFFGIAFLWELNENWLFPVLWPLLSFPNEFSTFTAVATGLEKVSFHSNPKERQCQRMLRLPHNCTHLTR